MQIILFIAVFAFIISKTPLTPEQKLAGERMRLRLKAFNKATLAFFAFFVVSQILDHYTN